MDTPPDVVSHWASRLLADPVAASTIDASFKFVVEGDLGGTWVFECRNPVAVFDGAAAQTRKADCTISVASSDFVSLAKGSLNPQMAFLSGKLRISGDVQQALKLHQFF